MGLPSPPPVSVSNVSETATSPIPIHWRRPSSLEAEEALGEHRQENETSRQHGLADRDRASTSAATCSANATAATPQPMLHHLERKRSIALRSGWRMTTSASSHRPPRLNRKAQCRSRADSSAQIRPTPRPARRWSPRGPLPIVDRAQESATPYRPAPAHPAPIKVRRTLPRATPALLPPRRRRGMLATVPLRRERSSSWTASPISQNIGGQRPTNSARRSAFPRSSWSTVFARIQSAMQR